MSAWLPVGVYAWWISAIGQDWPVIAAPALVCMCMWLLAMGIRWIGLVFGEWD